MKKTLGYLKYTKKEAILGPLFKMLEVAFELLVPIIVADIIDNGIAQGINYIIIRCLILLGFALLGFTCAVTAQYFSAKAAVKLATNLRNDLFKKIESLEYSELDEIGTSTLITRLTSDVNQVQTGVNLTLRLLLRSPVVVFGAMIVAFIIDVKVGYVFLIAIPVLFLVIFGILLISIPLFRKSQERLDDTVRLSNENLTGVRVIRAFNKQDDEVNKFKTYNSNLTRSQLFVGRISMLSNPLTYALINIFIIFVIYYGGLEVNSGSLSQGQVVALYNLGSQILVEMIKLANLIMNISKAIASSNRIEKVLDYESKLKKTENGEVRDNGNILEFDNVSMNYKGSEKNSLSNISFAVKKGQTIGVIGGTGSGKSTLVNLINHFYDINEGTIYYKGQDINSMDLNDVRSSIALVPQKAKLFKGTIKSNMLWGKEDATGEEIINAIKLAQGEDILAKKKDGIYEEVEADGKNFSGGQRQRLCIARALVQPSDLLILDDSSSALDYATDAKLRHALKTLEDKTVFIISQRTSSIQHCDQILVLDEGKLVGIGTHKELLDSCEVYREIYDSQFKKEAK